MLSLVPLLLFSATDGAHMGPDIVVTAERNEARVLPPETAISAEELTRRQPPTVGDALRGVPGVSARTNSRGETTARVRGAEERQTQVFLDGAPLAVPWDGRADVGIFPSTLFGEIRVVKGAAPIEYGTNAVAGVVDLRTRSWEPGGLEAVARAGSSGFREASLVGGMPVAAGLSVGGGIAGLSRDGFPDAERDGDRINTDLDSLTVFGAARYESGPFTGRAFLFHNSAERGIAPETADDPSLVNPRFWRYPDIDLTQLNLAAELALRDSTTLRFIGWRQWFGQTIDQYRDATYMVRSTRQEDRDDTLGGRFTLTTKAQALAIRLNASAQTSRHAQVDTPFPSGTPGPELRYRQNLYTVGAEADVALGKAHATFGIAYDRAETPLTGDKPPQPAVEAPAFSAAVRTPVGDRIQLLVSAGRRTRFPTARELFGEALGRFLINPDLRPEKAWLLDAELSWIRSDLRLSLNPFLMRVEDSISQRVVVVDGRSLRQRFNLPGSLSVGIDAAFDAQLGRAWSLETFASLLSARADAGSGGPRRLLQRPSHELGGAIEFRPSDDFLARAQLTHVGSAIDLDRNGNVVELGPATQVDLRASRRIARFGNHRLFVTAAVDNVTDAVVTPQFGLPLPGRTFRFGLRVD